MPSAPRRPVLLPLLPLLPLLASVLVACASQPFKVELKPGKPLEAQAVAVFPFQFRWEQPAWRSYELSQLLTLQAMETGRYAVFGPGEFRLVHGQAANPFVGSDLVLSLADRGLSPTAALVFRAGAEKRSTSAVKQVFDPQGKPKGHGRIEEAMVVARIEVFHSASREIVAVATGHADLDPFRTSDPSDPLPELTGLLQALMAEVLTRLEERAPGLLVERAPGFEYLWNPKAAFEFSLEGKPALSETLEKADALDRELLVGARLRFFHPEAEAGAMKALERLPAGLYVTEVGEAARAAGLRSGDLVVGVEREPALPQALQRALRRAAPGTSLALQVRRETGIVTVALPVP